MLTVLRSVWLNKSIKIHNGASKLNKIIIRVLSCCIVVLLLCSRYRECSSCFIDEIDIKQEAILSFLHPK